MKLAFSSEEKQKDVLFIIESWEKQKHEIADMDWREFQQEYRDYIGAVIGATANYKLLDQLGETILNSYR